MQSTSTKRELMTLRRLTRIDELIDSVPKPRNAVPSRGLPLWSQLPLEAKLPVLHGPKRELVFSRDKIGRKLWQNPQQSEFILYDPNCLDVSYQYDSLHDENLRRFFMNKVNRKRMLELGLITKDGGAICSLRDYNEYRRYLKRVHNDAINVERVSLEVRDSERFLLRKARENEERDLMSHAIKRVRKVKMRHLHEKRAAELLAKEEALIASQEKHANRLLMIARKKEEDLHRRIEKAMAFEMKIRQRNDQAQAIERMRKIKAIRKWHDNDVARKKRMINEKWRKIMDKEMKEYHFLHIKKQCQEERMERQREILDQYKKEMALRAAIRRKNVEHNTLKMEGKLMKKKAERVRLVAEHAWSIKAMVKALCKAWEDKLKDKTPEQVKEERCLIEKTIQLEIAEFKNKSEGKEVLAILKGAKMKLDKLFGVPESVSVAVDSLLNNVIMAYVKKKVDHILSDTVNQAEIFTKKHEEALLVHHMKNQLAQKGQQPSPVPEKEPAEKEKPLPRKASIAPNVNVIKAPPELEHHVMKTRSATRSLTTTSKTRSLTKAVVDDSTSSLPRPERLVSFGTIVTIDQLREELTAALPAPGESPNTAGKDVTLPEDLKVVRRTKDRPPTPVPSLTGLVEAAFNDPVIFDAAFENDTEKQKLDQQLTEFSKKLLVLVLKKADTKVEKQKRKIYRQLSHLDLDTEVVVGKIARAILYHEDSNLMELREVDHVADVLAKEIVVNRAHQFSSTLSIPGIEQATPGKKLVIKAK